MRFEFEADTYAFDLAAEEEILLRHASTRKKAWLATLFAVAAFALLPRILGATGFEEADGIGHLGFILGGILLSQQALQDYSGGNLRSMLRALYRGRDPWGSERTEMALAFEGDTLYIYRGGEEVGMMDLGAINAVTESQTVFDIQLGGFRKSYIAIPKETMVKGDADAFRAHLCERIRGKKEVRFYSVGDKRRRQLAVAKARLFPKY